MITSRFLLYIQQGAIEPHGRLGCTLLCKEIKSSLKPSSAYAKSWIRGPEGVRDPTLRGMLLH